MSTEDEFDFGPLEGIDTDLNDFEVDDNELFSFDEPIDFGETEPELEMENESSIKNTQVTEKSKKRSSNDFEPDMDALLITAQSPMIIEAMKYITLKDYSSKRHSVFMEAIKGVELYIKIIGRSPKNYLKLTKILSTDIDCKEVEKIAFSLYRTKFGDNPKDHDQKLHSFEIFKEKLKNAYNKSQISSSMVGIKNYLLLSGGLDLDKINQLIKTNDIKFKSEIAKMNKNIKLAMNLLKIKDNEIAKGMKGKDINVFIIKASQLLYYYYHMTSNKDAENYYKRINSNFKKYFIIRD